MVGEAFLYLRLLESFLQELVVENTGLLGASTLVLNQLLEQRLLLVHALRVGACTLVGRRVTSADISCSVVFCLQQFRLQL